MEEARQVLAQMLLDPLSNVGECEVKHLLTEIAEHRWSRERAKSPEPI